MKGARLERFLLGCLLGLGFFLALVDNGSETAAQMRANKPWSAWLSLREPGSEASRPPSIYLLIYSWNDRLLHLIRMPETAASRKAFAASGDRAMVRQYDGALVGWESPRLIVRGSPPIDAGSLGEVRTWIASWPRTARFWLGLPAVVRRLWRGGEPSPGLYDSLLLAREAFRLEPERVRAHTLPAPRDIPAFFLRVSGAERVEPPAGPLAVEILNASGEPGVALQATKVLRWRGLDVVDFGNSATLSAFTRLIDHGASYEEASRVARILGCGSPEIADEMDLSRRERVTVILGRDYKRCAFLEQASQNP